jgi:hypothetical protein
MLQVPKVGLAVHVFLTGREFNGAKDGPFAGVITQVCGDPLTDTDPYVNVKVFPPFADCFHEGFLKRGNAIDSRRYAFIE